MFLWMKAQPSIEILFVTRFSKSVFKKTDLIFEIADSKKSNYQKSLSLFRLCKHNQYKIILFLKIILHSIRC